MNFSTDVSIGKNIFLFILFSLAIFYLYFNVVVSSIDEYKAVGDKIKKYDKVLMKTQQDFDYYYKNLNVLKSSNRRILKATINEYTALEIGKYLQSNFSTFDIRNTAQSQIEDKYKFISLDIKVKTASINNFYRFMQQINSSNNIIKIAFPVELKSTGKTIDIRFKLKVYTFKRFLL